MKHGVLVMEVSMGGFLWKGVLWTHRGWGLGFWWVEAKQSQRLRKDQIRGKRNPDTSFPVLGGTLFPSQFPKAKAATTKTGGTKTLCFSPHHQRLFQCETHRGEESTWERVADSTSHLTLGF